MKVTPNCSVPPIPPIYGPPRKQWWARKCPRGGSRGRGIDTSTKEHAPGPDMPWAEGPANCWTLLPMPGLQLQTVPAHIAAPSPARACFFATNAPDNKSQGTGQGALDPPRALTRGLAVQKAGHYEPPLESCGRARRAGAGRPLAALRQVAAGLKGRLSSKARHRHTPAHSCRRAVAVGHCPMAS